MSTIAASTSPAAACPVAGSRTGFEEKYASTQQQQQPFFDIDNAHAVISNDPLAIYAEYSHLRTHCPLIHTSRYGGYWLLTRYADVKRAALDSDLFISSVKAVVPSDPRGIRRPPLNFDAPAHTPFRTALERTLKPARLRRLRAPLRRHAEEELDALLALPPAAVDGSPGHGGNNEERTKRSGDISAGFAARFAARVETSWLNLDPEVAPRLAAASAAWLDAWRRQDGDTVTANSAKMYEIARALLVDRRENPRDPETDPASSLLREKDPATGEALSEEHLVGCLRQSLVVGMVAPPIMVGSICRHLAGDKELQGRLREEALRDLLRESSSGDGGSGGGVGGGPSIIQAAVDEFLRLYTPYRGFARTASRDVEMHGQTVRPGEPVTLHYTAANRDPEVFENPDEFVLFRENIAQHMAFGRGRHRCVGMGLARLAIETALRVILEKTTDFDVDGPLEYSRMPELGIISCPLRFAV